MNPQTLLWIKSTLANDEQSSPEELVAYFVTEGPMTTEEAETWVTKRDFYSNNIVQQDEMGSDVGIYDPKTRTVKPL
jgi:hypothetical protein